MEDYKWTPVKGPYNGEIMEMEIVAHIIRTIFSEYRYKMVVKNGNEIYIVSRVTPEVIMKLF